MVTGTSVDPAQNSSPAIFAGLVRGAARYGCLWLFEVTPLVGEALTGLVYWFVSEVEAG